MTGATWTTAHLAGVVLGHLWWITSLVLCVLGANEAYDRFRMGLMVWWIIGAVVSLGIIMIMWVGADAGMAIAERAAAR